jgi:hypothetical protein
MLCDVYAFNLALVAKLIDATLGSPDKTDAQHTRTAALRSSALQLPESPPPAGDDAAAAPVLWWMKDGGAFYLSGSGAPPVYAQGCGPERSAGDPLPSRAIVLDDELVLDVIAALDLDLQHLIIFDSPGAFQIGAATLRPQPAPGCPRIADPSDPGRFHLDDDSARGWVTRAILTHELGDLDNSTALTDLPPISMDWQPGDPGQEQTIIDLLHAAQRENGPLAHPAHGVIELDYADDGDDGCLRLLVRLTEPAPLTLAGPAYPIRTLCAQARGADAALLLLHHTVTEANELLRQFGIHLSSRRAPDNTATAKEADER